MSSFTARRDVYAGALLIAIGGLVAMAGREHPIGTLTDMQAGYFPVVLGVLLAAIGLIIGISGFFSSPAAEENEQVHPADLRGGVAIVMSVICFVVLGEYAGLAPATFVAALIASAGDRSSTLAGALALSTVLTVVAVVLFVWILKIPFPPLRW